MTAVIDTSVYIANFKSKSDSSNPKRIWQALLDEEFIAISTKHTLQELILVMKRQKFERNFISNMVRTILKKSIYYEGLYEATRLNDIDPKDNMLLAACLESNADYLISLDTRDVVPLKHYQETQIVMPDGFLRAIKKNDDALSSTEAISFIKKEISYIIK